jgi:hypothetical protein
MIGDIAATVGAYERDIPALRQPLAIASDGIYGRVLEKPHLVRLGRTPVPGERAHTLP